jgi:aminoglycoside 3-N-acetyltransferase
MPSFAVDEISEQLLRLGVERGGVLLVHSSFRAVRPVENGPLGLVAALCNAVGDAGTLVMPTMTDGETPFDPRTTPTHAMGIVPELFFRQPGVLRSTHPGASFAARGPDAERICAPQPLSPPHGMDSPAGRVVELDGHVLLLGVTFSECTVLHVAESVAGVAYSVSHPCIVDVGGRYEKTLIAETDHCCRGFSVMRSVLAARGLLREGKIGNADAMLCRARDVLGLAVERLREAPLGFLCPPDERCDDCDEARRSCHPR